MHSTKTHQPAATEPSNSPAPTTAGSRSSFVIAVDNDLLARKHAEAIGPALWEFLQLMDWQTDDSGIVHGGAPIRAQQIADRLGRHERTVRENLKKLERNGYISLRRTPYGFAITILKLKKRFWGNALHTGSDEKPEENLPSRPGGNLRSGRQETGRKPASDRMKSSALIKTIQRQNNACCCNSSIGDRKKTSGLVPEFPKTAAAVRSFFLATDAFLTKLITKARTAQPEASDEQIAQAVNETYRGDRQKSAGLFLITVPEFLKNGSGSASHPRKMSQAEMLSKTIAELPE